MGEADAPAIQVVDNGPAQVAGAADGPGVEATATIQPAGFAADAGMGALPFTGAPSMMILILAIISITSGLATRRQAQRDGLLGD